MEALREVPGLLNALFIAIMIRFVPPIVGGLSLILMGAGMAAYSQANSFLGILIFSFTWSIGFHAWTPLCEAVALAFRRENGRESCSDNSGALEVSQC